MSKHTIPADKANSDLKGGMLVYRTEDGQVRLEVRLQNETVWLTQQMMAELFQTTVPNISMHIRNIYAEEELTPEATIKKFLTVRRRAYKESIGDVESIKQLEEAAKVSRQLEASKDPSDKEGLK